MSVNPSPISIPLGTHLKAGQETNLEVHLGSVRARARACQSEKPPSTYFLPAGQRERGLGREDAGVLRTPWRLGSGPRGSGRGEIRHRVGGDQDREGLSPGQSTHVSAQAENTPRNGPCQRTKDNPAKESI